MAASSQVSQTKRGTDECWKGKLAVPEAKRSKSESTVAYDSDLLALLDSIDNMVDANYSYPKDIDIGINGVINSLEEEISSNLVKGR